MAALERKFERRAVQSRAGNPARLGRGSRLRTQRHARRSRRGAFGPLPFLDAQAGVRLGRGGVCLSCPMTSLADIPFKCRVGHGAGSLQRRSNLGRPVLVAAARVRPQLVQQPIAGFAGGRPVADLARQFCLFLHEFAFSGLRLCHADLRQENPKRRKMFRRIAGSRARLTTVFVVAAAVHHAVHGFRLETIERAVTRLALRRTITDAARQF
jgi:hypothetical protein